MALWLQICHPWYVCRMPASLVTKVTVAHHPFHLPLKRYRRPGRKFPGQWKSNWTWCSPTSSQTSSRRWACGSAPCIHLRWSVQVQRSIWPFHLQCGDGARTCHRNGVPRTNCHTWSKVYQRPSKADTILACTFGKLQSKPIKRQNHTRDSLPLICSTFNGHNGFWSISPWKSGTTENPSQEGSKGSWIATSIKLSQVFSSDVTIVDFSESEINMKGKRSIYFLLATWKWCLDGN